MRFPTPNMGAPQTPQQGSWGGDFSDQLNDMLAPYKQMSQQFQSPYATMRPQGWLQDNHPQLARTLDNAFLTMGMTPESQGPEGAGGGISRAMQGLIGGQQFNRQRMMQQVMMPYQMLGQSLQPMDMMSQIQERHGQALRAEGYYQHQQDWEQHAQALEKIAAERDQTNAAKLTPSELLDSAAWRGVNGGQGPKDRKNPTPEEVNAYIGNLGDMHSRMQKAQREPSQSERMVQAEEEEGIKLGRAPLTASQRNAKIVAYDQQIQGVGAGARAGATQPYVNTKDFIDKVEGDKYRGIGTLPKEEEYYATQDPDKNRVYDPELMKTLQAGYQKLTSDYNSKKNAIDQHIAAWRRSDAPSRYIDPSEWQNSTPSAAPVVDSGSSWTRDRK